MPASIFLTFSLLTLLALAGCKDAGSPTKPDPVEEGLFVADTSFTIDAFNFDSLACAEVFPAGSTSSEAPAGNAVAHLRVISTSCYHVHVAVIDTARDTVRTFESRFAIFNRSDSEKNRGVVGSLSWDGKDDKGAAVPKGAYRWRMEFDFGAKRALIFRTDFLVP